MKNKFIYKENDQLSENVIHSKKCIILTNSLLYPLITIHGRRLCPTYKQRTPEGSKLVLEKMD